MEAQPVSRQSEPRYPTSREAEEDRFFLARHLPPLWSLTGTASIALALQFAGVSAEGGGAPETPALQGQEPVQNTVALVAPVFEHGAGRGAIGCVVSNPPVFLPEDEAMAVIMDELAKHGVTFAKRHVALMDVVIPKRIESFRVVNGQAREEIKESAEEGRTLILDGLDEERNVAVEFVSENEYVNLGGAQSGSTVMSYNMLGVARSVSMQVKKDSQKPIKLGVFYDPLTTYLRDAVPKEEWERDPEAAWKKAREASLARSRELLRQQAQDFVAWLKEQKAL